VARAVDNAGNVSANSNTVTIQRDTQAPNAPSLSLSGFSSGTWNPTTLNVQDNGDNGPSGVAAIQCSVNNGSWGSCPSNVASLGHGTTIVARAVDNAGNVSGNSNTVTIQRDTQSPNAPGLSLSGFSSGTWNPTTLNVQNNGDNGPSGVAAIQCSVNGGSWGSCPSNVASLGHGATIVARAVDAAGNVSSNSNTVTIQRDTQAPNAPSLSLSGFSSGTWNPTTLNVQNNGDNGPSGVAAFQCSVNNGSWGSCPSNVASLGHGTTIVARAVDNAGNVGANSNTVTIQRDTQAPNAPSVSLGGFSGGTWNPTTISYAHNGDNGPSGVNWPASLECSVDGGAWSSTCPDNSTLLSLPHGTTIAARVRDNAGNQGPAGTATVQRDTTPPATAISAIAPEYRNTPPQLFYAPTSDGGSPFTTARLLRRQSGADPWTDSGALTNGMVWTPPAQGRWYVASKVTDEANNVEPDPTGATDDATFFYDTVAPSAPTVLSVGPSNSRTPNVAWSASSDPGAPTTGSGVWTYRVLILRPDNSVVTQFDVPAPATNANVNVSLDDGNYIARVAAIDRAGNLGAYSAGYAFSVDSTTTFSGVVYNDIDLSGRYDGTNGVGLVPVTLTQPTSAVSTTTTSALGGYSFDGFTTLGYYTITIQPPPGYVALNVTETRRLVRIGDDYQNINFRLRENTQNLNYLWVNAQCTDGSPFPNAPFSVAGPALNTTAETGAEGNWAAEVSQPGVYTVTLIDTGIPLVAPGNANPVAVNVPAGGSAGAVFVLDCSDINEGTGAIVVRLFNADNPAATPALYAGLPVTASDGVSVLVRTTNQAGYAWFTGLISGTWMVTAPVIGGQWLVQPGFEAYAQVVYVVAPLASQVRYGYRAQNAAAVVEKDAEDLTPNGGLHVGDVIRYTVSVTNNTGITLTTVRITDTLPVGLRFNGIESVTPAGCNAGPSGGQVLGLCAELGPGEMMRVVFTATVTGTGRLVNSFVWSADQVGERPGDECANAPCDGEDPRPRARLHKRGEDMTDNGGFFAGDTVRYTLRFTNTMLITQTNLRITDTLPVQLTLAGVSVPAGCVDTSTGNVASVLCAEVAPGQVVQVLITATVNLNAGGQTITNTFSWSSDQGDGELERPCVNAPCDPDDPNPPEEPPIGPLAAVKAAEDATDNGRLFVGDTIRYTLTVTNVNAVTMTNVRITDVLPVELSLAGVDSVSAGCNDESSGNTVRASCAELAPGASATVVFRAVVQPAAAGRAIENRFVWTADQWPQANNPSNTCINAPCGGENPTRGSRGHKVGVGELEVGAAVTYTLVVTNETGATLVNLRITDTLPAQLTLTSVNVPAGCADQSAGNVAIVTCPMLPVSQAVQVEVYATVVTTTGEIVNTFTWTADNLGPDEPPECWGLPCDSEDRPNLDNAETGKQVHASAVRVGELVTYTITLSNSGTTTATVAVTDVLDARLSYVGANIAPDSTAGGVLAWHGVVVPAGEARHITVTVRAGANTPLWASYVVTNSVQIAYRSQTMARDAAGVEVEPRRVFLPMVMRPPELAPRVFIPMVMREP
jgi:uncharacterized repeat protein (TIGR01451 family)